MRRYLYLYLCLIPFAFLLVSCSEKPPTDAECRVLNAKEVEFVLSTIPLSLQRNMSEELSAAMEPSVEMCVAGKTYSHADYECMVGAINTKDIGVCLDKAKEHIKK
ncbi:MAG: hypothetical protein ABI644_07845 [Arenimonas sp.]